MSFTTGQSGNPSVCAQGRQRRIERLKRDLAEEERAQKAEDNRVVKNPAPLPMQARIHRRATAQDLWPEEFEDDPEEKQRLADARKLNETIRSYKPSPEARGSMLRPP
jgi:hypothetical protein